MATTIISNKQKPKRYHKLIPARDLMDAEELYWLIHLKCQKRKAENAQ